MAPLEVVRFRLRTTWHDGVVFVLECSCAARSRGVQAYRCCRMILTESNLFLKPSITFSARCVSEGFAVLVFGVVVGGAMFAVVGLL